MQNLADLPFAGITPSTFLRRQRRPYTVNDDDRQIQDSNILQKLQLILISMRQQSSKVTAYYQHEIQKLQSQLNEQTNVMELLQEENKLLRSHILIYENRFGSLSKFFRTNNDTISSEIEIQLNQEEEQDTQKTYDNKLSNCNKDFDDKKYNTLSHMSTNFKSKLENQPPKDTLTIQQKIIKQENRIEKNSRFTDIRFSQNGSSCSNFYKKSVPFHHRRQSSQQQNHTNNSCQSDDKALLPLVTHCKDTQNKQLLLIQGAQSRKNTIIDHFMVQNYKEQKQESQQEYQLGLESKGQGFFCQEEEQIQGKDQQQELIENNQTKYLNCGKFVARFVQSRQDFFEQAQSSTDSDKERMTEQLQEEKRYESINNQPVNLDNLQDLKQNYCKTFESYGHKPTYSLVEQSKKYTQYNNESVFKLNSAKSSICGQKRLRQLFSSLPQNVLSKKINMPFMKTQQHIKSYHSRNTHQSKKIQQLLESFEQNQKILFSQVKCPFSNALNKIKCQDGFKKDW